VPLEPVTGGVICSFSIALIFDRFYVSTQMPPFFLDCACLFFKHRCRKYKATLFFLWIIYKVLCGNATFFFRWVHIEESFLNDRLKNLFGKEWNEFLDKCRVRILKKLYPGRIFNSYSIAKI